MKKRNKLTDKDIEILEELKKAKGGCYCTKLRDLSCDCCPLGNLTMARGCNEEIAFKHAVRLLDEHINSILLGE